MTQQINPRSEQNLSVIEQIQGHILGFPVKTELIIEKTGKNYGWQERAECSYILAVHFQKNTYKHHNKKRLRLLKNEGKISEVDKYLEAIKRFDDEKGTENDFSIIKELANKLSLHFQVSVTKN